MAKAIDYDAIINSLAQTVLAPGAPKCQGWDPEDPAGCWMQDGPSPKGVDYGDGFRMFERYEDAEDYGTSLGKKTPFTLGFDVEVQRWIVTPLTGNYGS